MSLKRKISIIRDQRPVLYRYQPIFRWAGLIILSLVVFYCLYFLLRFVNTATPMWAKILPLIVAFIALDNILRKITNLNSVLFELDYLRLGFIAKKGVVIPYKDILSLKLSKKISLYLSLEYRNEKGEKREFTTPASFPKILEIIVNLADLAENAQIPENMISLLEFLKSNAENPI